MSCKAIYEFFWHKFCDWYIEISKIEKGANKETLLLSVLDTVLKLLHPIMPFITEEIWQKIRPKEEPNSIMVSGWPKKGDVKITKKEERAFAKLKDLIICVRAFKKDLGVLERVEVAVETKDKKDTPLLEENIEWIRFLSRSHLTTKKRSSGRYISTAAIDYDVCIPKEFIKDIQLHKSKIQAKIDELSQMIKTQKAKLANPSFVKKAPRGVVEGARERVASSLEERKRLGKIRWS